MMTAGTSLMIIDPNELFREGLRRILHEADFHSVWCSDRAPIGSIALLSDQVTPLLVIGAEIEEAAVQIAEVKRRFPTARPILLLDIVSERHLVAAFRLGAATVVLRDSTCETLISTLRLVSSGATVMPTELLDSLLTGWPACGPAGALPVPEPVPGAMACADVEPGPEACPHPSGPQASGLSLREYNVLQHLRIGLPNKEIARGLGITEATVKVHVKAILRKTKVRNRTQVALWANEHGIGFAPAPSVQCTQGYEPASLAAVP